MSTSPKKPFKLNVTGLFYIEAEDWTVAELAIILGMLLLFILVIVFLLKIYALPALSIGKAVKQLKHLCSRIRI